MDIGVITTFGLFFWIPLSVPLVYFPVLVPGASYANDCSMLVLHVLRTLLFEIALAIFDSLHFHLHLELACQFTPTHARVFIWIELNL